MPKEKKDKAWALNRELKNWVKNNLVLTEEEEKEFKENEEELDSWVKQKFISKSELPTYRLILALFTYGADKEKVKKIANSPMFEKQWANLEKNGYFTKDKKIDIGKYDSNAELNLSIIPMGTVANGLVKRSNK